MSHVKCQSFLYPNYCDGTSPSRFLIPAMWCELSGAVLRSLMRSDNTLTRRPATFEIRDANFVVQDTVGVLSDPIRMCFHFRQTTNPSRTSHPRRNATISKSELVISPLGLFFVSRRIFMSDGHSTRHTVGFNSMHLCATCHLLHRRPTHPEIQCSQPRHGRVLDSEWAG